VIADAECHHEEFDAEDEYAGHDDDKDDLGGEKGGDWAMRGGERTSFRGRGGDGMRDGGEGGRDKLKRMGRG
jgi:hypothetical protein